MCRRSKRRAKRRPVPIRQIREHGIPRGMRAQRTDDDRQWIGEDFGKRAFFGEIQPERQLLDWRAELRIYSSLVAARVDPIPAESWQMRGIQSVQ